jgi:hypothetical protein
VTPKGKWTSTSTDQRSQIWIVVWSLIWVASFLAVDVGIDRTWINGDAGFIAATAIVSLIGVGWLMGYLRFLRFADELVRKVQLEAMAMAVGVGFVGGFGVLLLDAGGLVEAQVTLVLEMMAATYMVAVVFGRRRYS